MDFIDGEQILLSIWLQPCYRSFWRQCKRQWLYTLGDFTVWI